MKQQNIAVTTDSVIFHNNEEDLKILLVKRKGDPFKGQWALPGGFLEEEETLEACAIRELEEETGLQMDRLYQLRAFGTPGRDPRGRTVTIVFWGEIPSEEEVKGRDDAAEAAWFPVTALPELAFDHEEIITFAAEQYELDKMV